MFPLTRNNHGYQLKRLRVTLNLEPEAWDGGKKLQTTASRYPLPQNWMQDIEVIMLGESFNLRKEGSQRLRVLTLGDIAMDCPMVALALSE
jgi:hypothetical protein